MSVGIGEPQGSVGSCTGSPLSLLWHVQPHHHHLPWWYEHESYPAFHPRRHPSKRSMSFHIPRLSYCSTYLLLSSVVQQIPKPENLPLWSRNTLTKSFESSSFSSSCTFLLEWESDSLLRIPTFSLIPLRIWLLIWHTPHIWNQEMCALGPYHSFQTLPLPKTLWFLIL